METLTTSENTTAVAVPCPVCGTSAEYQSSVPGWGDWRCCPACTLEFAHPLRLGSDPKDLFNAAYQGKVDQSAMTDFHGRVAQRHVIIEKLDEPSLWFWTPAFTDVLAFLKRRIPRGSTVLELGCGLGFYLHALRKEGFNAVGLDVAETVVELNRNDGFTVWHGPIESMPRGWVKADAVVSFFMLHHLEDPIGFLRAIRQQAPSAPLAIAVYGPTNKGLPSSLPPRTLIRWNAQALATALRIAGYAPTLHEIASSGAERTLLQPLRKTLARTMKIPLVYRLGKRLESRVLSQLPNQGRKNAYVVLALAEPTTAGS